MWTAARHLQAEVDNLTSHFPLEIKVSEDGSTLAMHATLLMLKLRAKVVVVATCTLDATTGNEKALFSPENVGVELVYGQAE